MRGPRVPQLLWLAAVIAASVLLWAGAPSASAADSTDEPEECGPYTRTHLEEDRASTTTTTAIDPVAPVPGRGEDVDPDAVAGLLPDPAPAAPERPADCPDFVYPIQHPLLGSGRFASGFGAARDGGARMHMGVDLLAPKLTPVVAVADGTVAFVRDVPERCCYLGVRHDDGWESWYIHLNNDRLGTDDGEGVGIRPGLRAGQAVSAGDVIGWVGDSGNAESTEPHLHFELHLPSGEPIDAWPSVREASTPAPSGADVAVDEDGEGSTDVLAARVAAAAEEFAGPFADDEGLAAEESFARLVAAGVPLSCDGRGVLVCPDLPALGDVAEGWVAAVTGTERDPSVSIAYGTPAVDPDLDRSLACSVHQFCPTVPITAGEAAAMLVGADDGTSVLSPAVAMAQLDDRLGACPNPPTDRALTRAELAMLLGRWLTGGEDPCPEATAG